MINFISFNTTSLVFFNHLLNNSCTFKEQAFVSILTFISTSKFTIKLRKIFFKLLNLKTKSINTITVFHTLKIIFNLHVFYAILQKEHMMRISQNFVSTYQNTQ